MEGDRAAREGGFATRAVHGPLGAPPPAQSPLAPPIYPSAAWSASSVADLGDLLDERAEGFVYGRYGNPTNAALHAVVAALHEAEAAWSLASGMAAIHATLEAVREGGALLVTNQLYGGTRMLLEDLRQRAGWQVDYAPLTSPDDLREALEEHHTAVLVETIANPSTAVADLAGLAEACRDAGAALVVDNTFASPYLCRPLPLGATAVVESATKFLGGHGDVVAGVVAADVDLIRRVRRVAVTVGGTLGPFEAWLVARGIQTLPLRMRAACDSAVEIARLLDDEPTVGAVAYPGLDAHPDHALALAQFGGRGYGAVLSFELPDRPSAEAFADACRVVTRATSLGSTHTLVLHPASTSHRELSPTGLAAAGIAPGTVRLSMGIEDRMDLLADVRRALSVAAGR